MAAEAPGCRAVLVEAFSAIPFAGNGAAVVLLEQPQTDAWMQALARSLNQSETAFLLEAEEGWLLRWFTPGCEVELCGHATLAALLALGHWGRLQPGETISLHSRSGPLAVRLDPLRPGSGSLVLPSAGLQEAPPPASLLELLRRQRLGEAEGFWTSGLGYSVALLAAEAPLEQMGCPASELGPELRNGLVLMQPLPTGAVLLGEEAADYQLRFFAPGLGIAEDPVTGSAHALVAPWWQKRLARPRVVGWQCSDRPGGMVSEVVSSGMIRLFGSGHLLWDGILRTASPASPGLGRGAWARSEDPWPALWSAWRTATRCG